MGERARKPRRGVVRVLVRIDSDGQYMAFGSDNMSDDDFAEALNWERAPFRGERDIWFEVEVDLPEKVRTVRTKERAR